jgi:hypothetical protein
MEEGSSEEPLNESDCCQEEFARPLLDGIYWTFKSCTQSATMFDHLKRKKHAVCKGLILCFLFLF